MSECPGEEELSAFVDGELPAERTAAIEAHVTACGACGGEVASLRELASVTAEMGVPAVSQEQWSATWSAIAARTVGAAEGVQPVRWWTLRRPARWAQVAAAAAVFALSVNLWAFRGPRLERHRPPEVASVCAVEYVEAADGYVTVNAHYEEADVTVITVLPVEPEEPPTDGQSSEPL